MAAGEGIETMLSLRCVMPTMPMVAALSAAHLAAILFPATLRRLYIARDDDPAGDSAMASLIDRASEAGIEAITLSPRLGTSTRISGRSASMRCGPRCGCRSLPRTSLVSWNWRHEPERRMRPAAARGLMSHRVVVLPRVVGEDRAHGLLRGRSGQQTARPGNGGWPTIFRRRQAAFTSRGKIAGPRHPPLRFGRFASLRGAGPVRPPPFVAMKAAMGAVDPTKGSTP